MSDKRGGSQLGVYLHGNIGERFQKRWSVKTGSPCVIGSLTWQHREKISENVVCKDRKSLGYRITHMAMQRKGFKKMRSVKRGSPWVIGSFTC